jgi:hypothetical protein
MHGSVLHQTCSVFALLFGWLRGADYSLFAIGLGMMSFNASLLGRFAFSRLLAMCCALFLLSSTPALLSFLTDGEASTSCPA